MSAFDVYRRQNLTSITTLKWLKYLYWIKAYNHFKPDYKVKPMSKPLFGVSLLTGGCVGMGGGWLRPEPCPYTLNILKLFRYWMGTDGWRCCHDRGCQQKKKNHKYPRHIPAVNMIQRTNVYGIGQVLRQRWLLFVIYIFFTSLRFVLWEKSSSYILRFLLGSGLRAGIQIWMGCVIQKSIFWNWAMSM